jgi:hypothetical protein
VSARYGRPNRRLGGAEGRICRSVDNLRAALVALWPDRGTSKWRERGVICRSSDLAKPSAWDGA